MAGGASEFNYTVLNGSRDSLASNNPYYAYLSNSLNANPRSPYGDGISETTWIGQFLRASYDLGGSRSRVLFAATGRLVWSKQPIRLLPIHVRAWNLTGRPWFDEKDWLTSSKWCKLGTKRQRRGGDYAYNPIIVNGLNYTFGSEQAQTLVRTRDHCQPGLALGRSEQINLGPDMDFMEGRWNVIFDIYEVDPGHACRGANPRGCWS